MSTLTTDKLQRVVYDFYERNGRHHLPWRMPEPDGHFDGYKILVSEIMLQQTQVERVLPRYLSFIERFPTVTSVADASQADIMQAWTGLGYYRRARNLHQSCQMIMATWNGRLPQKSAELVMLPGVGANTAGALMAYTFNAPVVFVETNIRTVFLYYYLADRNKISDTEIKQLVEKTLDKVQPRQWYWALMDYGSYLKKGFGTLNQRSTSYRRQAAFSGSRRQLRGAVIAQLTAQSLSLPELSMRIADNRLAAVLEELCNEKLIRLRNLKYEL